jgi:hypothetical protein
MSRLSPMPSQAAQSRTSPLLMATISSSHRQDTQTRARIAMCFAECFAIGEVPEIVLTIATRSRSDSCGEIKTFRF